MDYISVKKASERSGVTPRWIQKLCEEGKIDGAIKLDGSNIWMIPSDFALYSNAQTENTDGRSDPPLR